MSKPIGNLLTCLHFRTSRLLLHVRTLAVIPPGLPGGTKKGTWRPTGPPGMPKNTDPKDKKTIWKPPLDYDYDKVVRHCPVCNKKFIRRNMMLQHVNDNYICRDRVDPETRAILYHEFVMRKFNNKKYRKW